MDIIVEVSAFCGESRQNIQQFASMEGTRVQVAGPTNYRLDESFKPRKPKTLNLMTRSHFGSSLAQRVMTF